MLQVEFLRRAENLNQILAGAQLEDFAVTNEDRSVNEVALEVLRKAGWI